MTNSVLATFCFSTAIFFALWGAVLTWRVPSAPSQGLVTTSELHKQLDQAVINGWQPHGEPEAAISSGNMGKSHGEKPREAKE